MTAGNPATRSCPDCGAGTASSGPVRATVDGPGPTRCPVCGTAGDRHGTLPTAVRAAIAERLVGGVGRAGAARCGACGTGLDLPMRATSRALAVVMWAGAPFTVTVELPLVRCGGCAVDNVPPELVAEVERTTLAACGVTSTPAGDTAPLRRLRRLVGRGSRGRPSRP